MCSSRRRSLGRDTATRTHLKTGRLIQRHLQDRLAAGAVIALLASAVFVPDAVAGALRASAPVTGATAPRGTKTAIPEAYRRPPMYCRPPLASARFADPLSPAHQAHTHAARSRGASDF